MSLTHSSLKCTIYGVYNYEVRLLENRAKHSGTSKKAGLKQRELADQVHVTAQHISHIETGQTQVSLPVLISISDALKVDLNTLVGYTVTNAQSSAYRGELEFLLTQMGEKKAQFCLELCRMLAAADL